MAALPNKKPTLIVFSGLPGVGKTALARVLAMELRSTYLRIDAIEQALRGCGRTSEEIGASGYEVAYVLAETNLRQGNDVVADSVNPILITRLAWRSVAERAPAKIIELEIVCSNEEEHRRRVESRAGDITGLKLPSWQEVTGHRYEQWDRDRIVIDTARSSLEDASVELRRKISQLSLA
jgi:predicted kinase